MKFDIDTYKEIIEALSRNKSRSFLTDSGVFWGIFMLTGLIGGGQGSRELLNRVFEGFATNPSIIFAQPTTKPYDGYRKGRKWTLECEDMEHIRTNICDLNIITPGSSQWDGNAIFGDEKSNCNIKGLMADYVRVETSHMYYDRYLSEIDTQQRRKMCILGKKVCKNLLPDGGDPCGQLIRIDPIYYGVVGVDYSAGNMQVNESAEESVIILPPLIQQAYNLGQTVRVICVTGRPGVRMSKATRPIGDVTTHAYHTDPTDEGGITMFNTEVMYDMVDNLFAGVNFLIWLVGIGTLLAGAIGVSNIMMVTVRGRATEIGIRRAIGATPRTILGQIIAEGIILIAVAGASGILFAVIILQLAEMSATTDGPTTAHFQINFWTVVGAVIMLSLLGVLAGLAPVLRAMSIKPVDAMRGE